jgi:hypothetical protein
VELTYTAPYILTELRYITQRRNITVIDRVIKLRRVEYESSFSMKGEVNVSRTVTGHKSGANTTGEA